VIDTSKLGYKGSQLFFFHKRYSVNVSSVTDKREVGGRIRGALHEGALHQ